MPDIIPFAIFMGSFIGGGKIGLLYVKPDHQWRAILWTLALTELIGALIICLSEDRIMLWEIFLGTTIISFLAMKFFAKKYL